MCLSVVREIAETHDPAMGLDGVRAYHMGPRFLVEVEVLMDASTPLRDTREAADELRRKVEAIHPVLRCFVRVGHVPRRGDVPSRKSPTGSARPCTHHDGSPSSDSGGMLTPASTTTLPSAASAEPLISVEEPVERSMSHARSLFGEV